MVKGYAKTAHGTGDTNTQHQNTFNFAEQLKIKMTEKYNSLPIPVAKDKMTGTIWFG